MLKEKKGRNLLLVLTNKVILRGGEVAVRVKPERQLPIPRIIFNARKTTRAMKKHKSPKRFSHDFKDRLFRFRGITGFYVPTDGNVKVHNRG